MTELVVITDSNLPADDGMEEILERAGFTVRRADVHTEDEVAAAAADATGLIVQWAQIGERALAGLPRLRAISRLGIGVDMVDTAAATRRGVAVANTPDYCVGEVSLHALALALALLRGIVSQDGAVRDGRWEPVGAYPGAQRPDTTTFGVLGYGRIGRRVVRSAVAMGFEVVVHDVGAFGDAIADAGATPVPLDVLLARSDLLTLHAPLTPDTRHLLGPEAIAAMKPGAFIVNTTRGELIDEAAVAQALHDRRLGGAALDVFGEEPLPAASPLRAAPNVILTPHSAWFSPEALHELPRRAAENLAALLAGADSPALLNPGFAEHRAARHPGGR